ncbi:MAG: hypothetical protein WD873_08680, partial [Candidatus Hydrogenedentales bacterium]
MLDAAILEQSIVSLLPRPDWDLLITHGANGEFARDGTHEQVSQAVTSLWQRGVVAASSLWTFAYDGATPTQLPQPRADAHFRLRLPPTVWREKQRLITSVYGFDKSSWEAKAAPRNEAFFCFDSPRALPKAA